MLSAQQLSATLESTPEGGYDAAFVAVGSARVIENAINLVRPGGRVVILGMPSDADLVSINMSDFAGEAKSVIGTKMGIGDDQGRYPAADQMVSGGAD